MTVEYSNTTVTNMDIEDSKIDSKMLLLDSSQLRYSVYVLRNSPYRVATICLGALCVILVAAAIGSSVHYQKVEQDRENNLKTMSKEIENLQENLKTLQTEKKNLEVTNNHLKDEFDYKSKKLELLQTNNNLLKEETINLKHSQSELQATNTALKSENQQLKQSRDSLQANNNVLSTAKDSVQKQYDSMFKRKTKLQADYDSVTKERDNLQNRYNNVTRVRDHLQIKYNNLIKDLEHLQDRFNFSSGENDNLKNHHQNLTIDHKTLQAKYNLLANATDELRASCKSVLQEKIELEKSCTNVTAERDQLKVINGNLTAERDQLQEEVQRLNTTIEERKCPAGWKKFQCSCYFTSVSKKSWSQSREYCQRFGADLATIQSQAEMTFINSLYKSDKEVWIGLTDEGVEGQWKWVDGTPLTTAYWGKGQPNSYDGRNQDCVEFWHRGSSIGDWNDENCNVEQNWICEK
ncbi:CD209 antigen-like [Mastacembelus armatus]|uniref:CD209 antigen-like n=1 Tax=Mastacembelus armatus TaxID=205130 RepID=A0A3Q3LAE9_9TELE|nr:CD209 antigen-like [Mastacembelus armatus]